MPEPRECGRQSERFGGSAEQGGRPSERRLSGSEQRRQPMHGAGLRLLGELSTVPERPEAAGRRSLRTAGRPVAGTRRSVAYLVLVAGLDVLQPFQRCRQRSAGSASGRPRHATKQSTNLSCWPTTFIRERSVQRVQRPEAERPFDRQHHVQQQATVQVDLRAIVHSQRGQQQLLLATSSDVLLIGSANQHCIFH